MDKSPWKLLAPKRVRLILTLSCGPVGWRQTVACLFRAEPRKETSFSQLQRKVFINCRRHPSPRSACFGTCIVSFIYTSNIFITNGGASCQWSHLLMSYPRCKWKWFCLDASIFNSFLVDFVVGIMTILLPRSKIRGQGVMFVISATWRH